MPLGPARTVHVTTREQLDVALQSADRVVVDGDDALLSYAVARASGDPAHRIDIELAAPPGAPAPPMPAAPHFDAPLLDYAAPSAPIPSGFETIFAPEPVRPAASPPAKLPARSRLWIVFATSMLVLALGFGVFTFLQRHVAAPAGAIVHPSHLPPPPPPAPSPDAAVVSVFPKSAAPHGGNAGAPGADDIISALSAPGSQGHTRNLSVSKPPVPEPPSAPAPTPVSPSTAAPPAGNAEMVQAIAWPAVAIIAIIALAIIARQAIATGRNVEFSWKVTEKVSGRVVITKVKNPQTRRGRTAAA